MSKFKVGDEVTPKEGVVWYSITYNRYSKEPPKFGQVYVVSAVHFVGGDWYLSLAEFPHNSLWEDTEFEKVISDRVLSEELETVKEPYCL
jgi:hypothetical protein